VSNPTGGETLLDSRDRSFSGEAGEFGGAEIVLGTLHGELQFSRHSARAPLASFRSAEKGTDCDTRADAVVRAEEVDRKGLKHQMDRYHEIVGTQDFGT